LHHAITTAEQMAAPVPEIMDTTSYVIIIIINNNGRAAHITLNENA
jgi:hypothetical protein